ncbi:MAG: cellulase family glycosylhydrolase [Candidatus Omnitrophica bacterium]|nr:cellulase family glycosylhydrolase [Candidatus Omnitrophota bacterium]
MRLMKRTCSLSAAFASCLIMSLFVVVNDVQASAELPDSGYDSYAVGRELFGADLAVGQNAAGETASFYSVSGVYRMHTLLDADGASWLYKYDGSGNIVSIQKVLPDGTIEIYDSLGRLIERRLPADGFIRGVNLPWMRYGSDLGKAQAPGTWHVGFSSETGRENLYQKLATRSGETVRLFLFTDLRWGVSIDYVNGNTPLGFYPKVFEDMRALLDAAKVFGVKLIPTLYDFALADNVNGQYLGEYPEMIRNSTTRQALLDVMETFLNEFVGDPSIYAWDIMNEPELAKAVTTSEIITFVDEYVDLIHSIDPNTKVTVGSHTIRDLLANWTDSDLDLYQFHYYSNMDDLDNPYDVMAATLNLDKPVIVGEIAPGDTADHLGTLGDNGYDGAMLWEDGPDNSRPNFVIDAASYQALQDWFIGSKYIYTHYASGNAATAVFTDEAGETQNYEFRDEDFFGNGTGRATKLVETGGAEFRYIEYWGDSTPGDPNDDSAQARFVETYQAGAKVITEEYDINGVLIGEAFPDGRRYAYPEYWPGTAEHKTVHYYPSASSADPFIQEYDQAGRSVRNTVPATGYMRGFTSEIAYYESGNMESVTFLDSSGGFRSRQEFEDSGYYGNHSGRLTKIQRADGSYDTFEYYLPNSASAKIHRKYDSGGILIEAHKYDDNGNEVPLGAPGATATVLSVEIFGADNYFGMMEEKAYEQSVATPEGPVFRTERDAGENQ